MMKKKLVLWLAAVGCIGSVMATPMDPNTRMEKVKELFTKYSLDTFKLLNGLDFGGSGAAGQGKAASQSARSEIASIIHSEDGNAFLFCVRNGKWAVYQPDPLKVGQDATTMTDADGKPFVATQIEAIKRLPNGQSKSGGKATVAYTALTPDGRKEHRKAIVWNSENLLSRKNPDPNDKFFCGTSIKDGG